LYPLLSETKYSETILSRGNSNATPITINGDHKKKLLETLFHSIYPIYKSKIAFLNKDRKGSLLKLLKRYGRAIRHTNLTKYVSVRNKAGHIILIKANFFKFLYKRNLNTGVTLLQNNGPNFNMFEKETFHRVNNKSSKARFTSQSSVKLDSRKAINRIFFLKNKQKNNWQNFSPNSIRSIHIYLADKRKVQIGDKMSGRHGNKGIVSQILPREDMPYLPDGTPLDMVLNPLGVPSRMNVGQIYECLLGFAGKYLGEQFRILPFDEIYGPEASRSFVYSKLYEARVKTGFDWVYDPNNPGKIRLYDGRTGDCFDQKVTVGHSYILRLVHMVDDKIHARSTGPYSLVTQQPLRGRSKQGGQRLGEMEVWALEGYGAAFTLLEMLTIKSDDMAGRMTLWSNLLLEKDLSIGTPESFKVLICELQALCLDIGLFRPNPLKNYRLEKIENLINLR
jgi:DNA-directed RNA polymerase subunit beta